MAFPLGMKVASGRWEALTPWFWGVNGATSVLASVLAVVIAMVAGISASFWSGFACYLGAFASMGWVVLKSSDSAAQAECERHDPAEPIAARDRLEETAA